MSSALHGPLAIATGLVAGPVGMVEGGLDWALVGKVAAVVGEPVRPAGGELGLWCEVSATATEVLAAITTTTPAAASSGDQRRPRLPRLYGRVSLGWPASRWPAPRRVERRDEPVPALASRIAMSSTVTLRGGSGVTRCSISASLCSSMVTVPHLRSSALPGQALLGAGPAP